MSEKSFFPSLQPGAYRHNKSGNVYEVLGVALDTESDKPVVVYKPLYTHEHGYTLFTRSYDAFLEMVEIDGQSMPRFELIE